MFRSVRHDGFLALIGALFLGVPAAHADSSAAQPSASAPTRVEEGLWLVKEKDGIFNIGPCHDKQDQLCGWLVGMDYTEAEPEKDIWGRSECGLQIISDMKPSKDGKWNGQILDPRSGRTYGARLWVAKNGQLKLLGYVGIPLLGQVQTWDRYQGSPIGRKCRMQHL